MAVEVKTILTAENRSDRAFRDLRNDVKQIERSLGDFRNSARTVAAAVAGVFGGIKVVGILRDFESLKASLRTVTGSAAAADEAFAFIETFAANTPFQLDEVVGAFIRLKSLGLDPSQAALEAYGNVAAAMGTSLNQFIEAIADAATGEFERLKEFGIRSSTQGEQVAFTFRGITTVVQKEAGAIEGYLRSLGEVEFAGAMAERSATLDGALSNLSDSASALARALGDAGLTQIITDAARALSVLTGEMAKAIKEGDGLLRAFQGLGSGAGLAVRGSDQRELGRLILQEVALNKELFEIEARIAEQRRRGGIVDSGLTIALNNRRERIARNQAQQEGLRAVLPPELTGEAPVPSGGGSDAPVQRENQSFGGKEDKAIAARARELQRLIERYRETGEAVGLTAREVALLRAEQLGANAEQVATINQAFNRIEAEEQLQDAIRAEEDALKKASAERAKAKREADALDASLENEAERFKNLIDPLRETRAEFETLNELQAAGKLTQQEYAAATAEVQRQLEEQAAELNKVENAFTEFALQGARNIQDAFADFLFDPLKDGFDGMLKNFGNVIRRMAAEVAAAELGKQLFGDFGKTGTIGGASGGLFDFFTGLFEQGGIVGATGPGRSVPALAFANAPRFREGGLVGLKPGERPIIAHEGEEVLRADDPRHIRNRGGMQISVNASVQGSVDERSSDQIAVAVANAATRARLRNT